MPLYRVAGKFADNHTFVVNPVEGADASAALASVAGSEEVKAYGQPIAAVSVMKLEGKKRVRISDEPAKPRAPRGSKNAAGNKPAAQGNASKPAASAPRR